jgi:hypothetical protein
MTIIEHFGEDAHGRDDHGHASGFKIKRNTAIKKETFWAIFNDLSTITNMLGTKCQSILVLVLQLDCLIKGNLFLLFIYKRSSF